jgi:bifunctional DNA-binding transcriptional regulator/antitoxin component of YhaV-PrlF toxin-antitoxin module
LASLSVTARGQVTFRKEVLKHLGIQPGGKITLDLLPGGRAELKAERPKGDWDDLVGFIKNKGVHLTIDEIKEATIEGYVAAGMAGMDAGKVRE